MRTRRLVAWLVFCASVTSVALGRAAGVPVGQAAGAPRPGDMKSLDVPPVLPAELDIARRARVILASKDVWNSRDQGFCPSGAVSFSIYCGLSEAGRANGDVAALNAALQEARLVVWDLVVSREYDHPLTDYNNESSTTFGDVQRLHGEARLEIVGAEHQGHDVDRAMAFQARAQVPEAVLVDALDRIVMERGATRQAFLDHGEASAQLAPEHARPALVGAEAPAVVAVTHRHRSVGVRIA